MRPYCSLLAVVVLSSTVVSVFGAESPTKEGGKLEASLQTWQRVKKECGGNYSYKLSFSSFTGFGHETEIVVRDNKVAERRFRAFGGQPVAVAPILAAPPAPVIASRKWTDSTGQHSVQAEFVDAKDGTVRLKREDGKTISVPIDKLSKADQQYVKSLDRPTAPPAKPEGKTWTETGEDLGTHKEGALPKTLDELYDEAKAILDTELAPHHRLYVRFDDRGLLLSCFYVDTRIMDDAPRTGVAINSIHIGAPAEGGAAEAGAAEAGVAEAEPAKPSGGRAINLSSADRGKTVPAGVGDLVIIELDANPTTGYSWEAGPLPDDGPLTLKSNKYETAAQRSSEIRPMVGQGGVATFTYQVVKTGKATIALAYRRPWEKDVKPVKTFTVTIEATGATGKTGPVVTGKILFSEEPDVDAISRIEVSIRNTALADGPAPLVGTVELKPPFELPVTFAVPYDPEEVQPNPMFYSLSARVYTVVGGSEKLYYINDTRHHVLSTADDTKRDIAVKKLR